MLNRWRTVVKWLVVAVVCLGAVSLVSAQASPHVDLIKVDASQFPLITLNVAVRDGQGAAVLEPAGLAVSEDGSAVASFDVNSVVVGAETIFVIDANDTIRVRDVSSGPTRLEKVRESIVGFSTAYMNQSQLDRVSIVVPDDTGETGQFLLENGVFPNEVINEINFYDPDPPDDAPLQAMLEMALRRAEQNQAEGRFQAIVLFTDGANLPNEIEDVAAVVGLAQAQGVPIYSVILGARADPEEVENVLALSEPTAAFHVHMPEVEAAEPLYEILRGYQSQTQVQYRSTAAESGAHTVAVALEGVTVSAAYEVTVEPPAVEITVDNSQPIRRVAEEADTALEAMEPAEQPIAARVEWPDGHPRQVEGVTLAVNGDEIDVTDADTEVVLNNGVLTFDWDIRELDEGEYELVVQVTDELGLVGRSEALPLTIEIERPEVAPAATSAPAEPEGEEVEPSGGEAETESETEPAGGLPVEITENLPLIGIVTGVLAILGSLFILALAVVFIRRRRRGPAEPAGVAPVAGTAVGTQPLYNPPMDHEATQVILPDFIARSMASAHLEPLENAPGHSGTIPITGNNIAIGRDAKLAQIVFSDKSVSRLHARIMESGGTYRIYDEGSASGTYLNYERIGLQPQPLKDNDEVHIGRVHLRFHVAPVADKDSTQIMGAPQRPGRAAEPAPGPAAAPTPADEGLGTQPYMPNQPQGPGRVQPPDASRDNPPDDVSTQPYMPHSPKR
jgi:hypothetical protein